MKSALRFVCAVAVVSFASHTAFAEVIKVAAIGDSLTNNYSLKLGAAFSNQGVPAEIVRCSLSGMNSSTLLAPTDYVGMAMDSKPDAICFMLGINDAWGDLNAASKWETYKTNVSTAFDRFENAVNSDGNRTTIVIATVMPFDLEANQAYWKSTGNSQALNRIENWFRPWLMEQANDRGFEVLDLWSKIQEQPDWESTMFGIDGLHCSPLGYEWVAGEFAGAVINAVPEPGSILLWSVAGIFGSVLAIRQFQNRRLER